MIQIYISISYIYGSLVDTDSTLLFCMCNLFQSPQWPYLQIDTKCTKTSNSVTYIVKPITRIFQLNSPLPIKYMYNWPIFYYNFLKSLLKCIDILFLKQGSSNQF